MAATPFAAFPTRPFGGVESAAVVRGNSIVRSLYSIQPKSGNGPIVWPDQLDDNGNLVTDTTGLEIIRELNNIESSWAGTINNTSTERTGSKVQINSHNITDILRVGDYVWRVFGYGEGEESNIDKTHVNRLNEHIQVHRQDSLGAYRLATDGQDIYISGIKIAYDDQRKVNVFRCFVIVIRPSGTDTGDVDVQVPGSVAIPSGNEGITYYALALLDSPEILSPEVPGATPWNKAEFINDHAVNSRFLVVARAGKSRVEVWRKTTNELVATHELTDPCTLDFIDDSTLTITTGTTVANYSLSESGQLQRLDNFGSLAGLAEPMKVRVSPDGTKLLVTDGNRLNDTRSTATHRFYIFDATTGEQLWVRGRQENYGVDARVYDDKYLLINTKEFTSPSADTSAFASWHDDSHVWLADIGNNRYQLVNINTNQIVAVVGWEGYHYALGLVVGDVVDGKGKLLVNYKQFEVDLALIAEQDIAPDNGAYRLTHNYSLCWRREYDDPYNRLAMPTKKASSGRTFALLQHQRPVDPTENVDFHLLLVEKTDLKIVYTDRKLPIGTVLEPDFSLTTYESTKNGQVVGLGDLGAILTRYTQPAIEDDANGLPQWGPRQFVWSTLPLLVSDPISAGVFPTRSSRSSNGRYLTYNTDVSYQPGVPGGTGGRGTRWHGGIMEQDGTDFLSRFLYATKRDYYEGNLPTDRFEDSNGVQVGGSYSYAVGDTFIFGANNEFWKGKATFDWKLYSDLGLMRHQGGRVNRADDKLGPAPASYATNSTRGDFVQVGDTILHFSTGEGGCGGPIVMRYKRFDTINFERLPLQPYTLPVEKSIDLDAPLPKNTVLENGMGGWTFTPAQTNGWSVATGKLETAGNDLTADFHPNYGGDAPKQASAQRALSLPRGPWARTGVLRFRFAAFDQQPGDRGSWDYLDTSGRLIASTYRQQISNDNCPLVFNGKVVGTRSTEAWRPYGYNPTPVVLGVGKDGRPYLEYADFTRFYADGPLDPTADVFAPGTERLSFQTDGTREYGINLYQSQLTSLTPPTTPPTMPNYTPSKKLSYARRIGADLPLDLTNAPFLASILKLTALTTPGSTGANARSTRTGGFGGATPGGTLTVWRKGQVLEVNAGVFNGSLVIPDAVEELPATITSLGPSTVAAGDLLNITGTNLATTKYVFVGGAQALISSGATTTTNVTVTVPLLATTGSNIPVVVVTETASDLLSTLTVTSGSTPAKLAAPLVSQPTNITSSGFTISWTTVTGADGYRVRLNNSTLFMPGNVTTYTFTGLPANTLATSDVQALDSTGAKQASNYSNVVTATTGNAPAQQVQLVAFGDSRTADANNNGLTSNWPAKIGPLLPTTGPAYLPIQNFAIGGAYTNYGGPLGTESSVVKQIATYQASNPDTTKYRVAVIAIGINDLQNLDSFADFTAHYIDMMQKVKAVGFNKIVLVNIVTSRYVFNPPRDMAIFAGVQQANNWLASNYVNLGANVLGDIYGDAIMYGYDAPLNTTNFQSDQIHYKDPGGLATAKVVAKAAQLAAAGTNGVAVSDNPYVPPVPLYNFSDDFERPDGAIGNGWLNQSAGTLLNGKLRITQRLANPASLLNRSQALDSTKYLALNATIVWPGDGNTIFAFDLRNDGNGNFGLVYLQDRGNGAFSLLQFRANGFGTPSESFTQLGSIASQAILTAGKSYTFFSDIYPNGGAFGVGIADGATIIDSVTSSSASLAASGTCGITASSINGAAFTPVEYLDFNAYQLN